MADRYWRGGTGTWDASSTTNWSATSGGGGGASAPTSADDVFFNSASNATAYTVTINAGAVCRSVTIAGPAAGNVTVAGSGAWAVFGSMTLPATGMTRTYSGTITFQSNTTRTITTNGVSLGGPLIFDRANGIWSLGSALTSSSSITVTNGTFSTANFALSASALLSTNSNTRSISLGSSTLTLSAARALDFTTSTGLTFNAGTSTINCTASTQVEFYAGSGQTFHNVSGTGTAGNTYTDIQGANTFNNLTITGNGRRITFDNNIVVNGTFTVTGGSSGTTTNNTIAVRPANFFTNRTITAAAVSLTDAQFYNITGAGTATWSGTRIGDAGLNSGITFPAPKTVYYNSVAGGNINGTVWALNSGASPAAANYPLCQDTGIIDDAGINAGSTINMDVSGQLFLPGLDFSQLTKNITFSMSQTPSMGACTWIFDSNVTTAGTGTFNMYGGGASINCNGGTLTRPVNIQNGTNTLTGPFVSSSTLTLTQGTLVLGGNVTCTTFTSNNTNTRQIQFGTNSINTTSTGTVFQVNGTNLTYTGTPTVNISNNSAIASTITAQSFTQTNALNFNITTGTYTLTESVNNVFRSMNYTGFAGTVGGATNKTYFGNLTLSSGMTYTHTGTLTFAATSGIQDITSAGKTLGPVIINGVGGTVRLQDALLTGATNTLTLTNGTFNANNQNVTVGLFASSNSNTRTLTMGSGTWTLAGTGSVWNLATTTNLTFNKNTANIVLSDTSTSARTFAGGSLTYNNLTIGGTTGTSTLTITGNNTFGTLASTKTVAHTIRFPAGGTNTFSDWTVSGTVGNVVTVNSSTTGVQTNLSKPSAWFVGANSTNVSNNTGLIFSGGGGINYLSFQDINGLSATSTGNFFFLFG